MVVVNGTTNTVSARGFLFRPSDETITTGRFPLPGGSVGISTNQIVPRRGKRFCSNSAMNYSLILSNCTASGIYYITARARSCSSNHISASKEIKTKVDIEDFTFPTPKRRKLTRSFSACGNRACAFAHCLLFNIELIYLFVCSKPKERLPFPAFSPNAKR
jgi:hypothetical protein